MDGILSGQVRPPDGRLALVDLASGPHGAKLFTYAWLHDHAKRLASALCRAAGGEQLLQRTAVAVLSAPCACAVAGMLAIWQLGACYLPLELDAPPSRLRWLRRDAEPSALLLGGQAEAHDALDTVPTVALESARVVVCATVGAATPRVLPSGTAYLLYTSGSTGEPKAVLGARDGLAARCKWGWSHPFEEGEVCAQKTAPTFVDSLWETLGPLGAHATLLVLPPRLLTSPHELVDVLAAWRVTRLVLVPAVLRLLCDALATRGRREGEGEGPSTPLPRLKLLSVSGDVLPMRLAERARELLAPTRLLNLYGSCEVSADVLCYEVGAASEMDSGRRTFCPLGWPVSGASVQLAVPASETEVPGCATHDTRLPRSHRAAGEGEAGEIWVGGDVVSLGYLGASQISADRFVEGCDGVRWFRTGDRAEMGTSGELHFLGRDDGQLKIRGARLEAAEVEAAYEGMPGVGIAAAVPATHTTSQAAPEAAEPSTAEGSGAEQLLLVYVPTGGDAKPGGVRVSGLDVLIEQSASQQPAMAAWGASRLPAWMQPSSFVALRALPLLRSGKIDRIALRRAASALVARLNEERRADRGGTTAPPTPAGSAQRSHLYDGSEASATLCAALGRLLGLSGPVDGSSSFVALGGTSVLAAQLTSALRHAHGWVLRPEALFGGVGARTATLAELGGSMVKVGGEGSWDAEAAAAARVLDGWGQPPPASVERDDGAPPTEGTPHADGRGGNNGHGRKRKAAEVGSPGGRRAPDCSWSPQRPGSRSSSPHVAWSLGAASSVTLAAPAQEAGAVEPAGLELADGERMFLRPLWSRELGRCVDASPLLICEAWPSDGTRPSDAHRSVTCVVGAHSGQLCAVDLASGDALWTCQLPCRIEAACTLTADGHALAVGGYDGYLHVVRRADGVRLWSRRAAGAIKGAAATLPLADGGVLVSGDGGGRIVALEPSSGGSLWEETCDGTVFAKPLVHGEARRLYAADLRGSLHAWDYSPTYTGLGFRKAWRFRTATRRAGGEADAGSDARLGLGFASEPIFSSPALVEDGAAPASAAVLFGCMDGKLYCVSSSDGAPLWTFDAAGPIFSTPCIASLPAVRQAGRTRLEPHAFITSQSGKLFCVRAADGELRWESSPCGLHGHAAAAVDTAAGQLGTVGAGTSSTSGARYEPQVVCAAAVGGRLHLIRSSDGVRLAEVQLPAAVFSSPALCASSVVVGCRDDALHCVALRAGPCD